ncbi:unnamed protein product [Moneuplotes crassus]|uniref:Uncharacterized protein n=1 Tax=Euplotes crassus TaxID=5936 RepID=A0AAD1X5W2_EUPCR|nr:unnamed protein product [Moneuplotes crassus]
MLNYLRAAKLQYCVTHERKKTLYSVTQILEFASRVPELQLLKLCNGLFGMICMGRDWKQAIKYFESMRTLCEHPREVKMIMNILKNIGICYQHLRDYPKAIVAFKKVLQYAWLHDSLEWEMQAYQNLATSYYYLRNLEKCRYYHTLSSTGYIESKTSYVRNLCEENLKKKLAQKEKERDLDEKTTDPSLLKLPKRIDATHYDSLGDEFDPISKFFQGVKKIAGYKALSKALAMESTKLINKLEKNLKLGVSALNLNMKKKSISDTESDAVIFSPKSSDILQGLSMQRRSTLISAKSSRKLQKILKPTMQFSKKIVLEMEKNKTQKLGLTKNDRKLSILSPRSPKIKSAPQKIDWSNNENIKKQYIRADTPVSQIDPQDLPSPRINQNEKEEKSDQPQSRKINNFNITHMVQPDAKSRNRSGSRRARTTAPKSRNKSINKQFTTVNGRKAAKKTTSFGFYLNNLLEAADQNRPSTKKKLMMNKASSMKKLPNWNTDYLSDLKEKSEIRRQNNIISVLEKQKEKYTFRNILERSKMIGKEPKMEISIAHLSPSRTSNRLLNTIKQANQTRIIREFDILKEELYKEKRIVKVKSRELK